MSAIINAGENLVLERQVSIAQTKTQGGLRVAQKRGPTLYNLEVDVPAQEMNQDRFFRIEKEVIDMQYGALDFQSAKVSGEIGGIGANGNGPTSHVGVWTGTPQINGSSNSGGMTISVKTGLMSDTTGTPEDPSDYYARAFDYVQFSRSTKVYQITEDANTESGIVKLKINSPLVKALQDNDAVEFGGNVNFNFALMERPKTTYQPGGIVQYGTFVFEEVILNVERSTAEADNSNPPEYQAQQIFFAPTVLNRGMTGPTGPQGDRGFTWFNGTSVPTTVTNSIVGDYFLDTETDKAYERVTNNPGETWLEIADFTGSQGIQGVRGFTWFNGTSAPATVANSVVGDYFLDTATDKVYERVTNNPGETWSELTDLTGSQGIQGDRGFTWFNATGVPTTVANSVNGDYYLDTGSSEPLLNKVYKRIDVGDPLVETWVEQTDLTGPTGLTGPAGSVEKWVTLTGYSAGSLVISDDRLWENNNTILATNTTAPENNIGTTGATWKEISSSQSAADDALAFAIALG